MAIDFFVAASLVLIFFCLFFAALFFGLYVSKKDRLESLKKQEAAAPQEQAVKTGMAEPSKGTPLDKEMLRQAIRFNGFISCETWRFIQKKAVLKCAACRFWNSFRDVL